MKILEMYTDGGCLGNPGPGAWAFVVLGLNELVEKSGYDEATTNNKMELEAVIQGLSHIQNNKGESYKIHIYTDSQYVKNGINLWIHNWKRNGWKTANRKPVKNQNLWQALDELVSKNELQWHWVKGHSGNEWNERCDQLVQEAMRK